MIHSVLIILTQGYADWETPLISAIGGSFFDVPVRHATPGGGAVTSIAGLHVTGLPDIAAADDDVIVLCGGRAWTSDNPPAVEDMLRAAHARGQTVAGICAATLALGRAGLFAGAAHTSNGLPFIDEHLPGYVGRDRYRDVPHAVADNRVISAPGSAPLSFAVQVLRAAGVGEDDLSQMQQMLLRERAG
ncbi:MAG: DJ-1/PfpI family protein [Paracoccus sp. (in: a-proteobacteria)]|uniref:DJ-1/PfpI family protein n=1 Tax=Paracoccus sp. TaxID=267 RepID=UPI0026DFA2B5|nr:DJ-1/PfpI family protein [Paracoccus sp. (in: a-proteobacteria)]MDO5631540.1 DJ-1/PfpI family protein [Paracoccus sp. (in: a-proteobacteria)]